MFCTPAYDLKFSRTMRVIIKRFAGADAGAAPADAILQSLWRSRLATPIETA